jgi:hypothetical protein
MSSLGLGIVAVVAGALLALLVARRRGSGLIEPSRRDAWLHAMISPADRSNTPGSDPFK